MNTLQSYLDIHGLLACNDNLYLPSLADIGCTWADMTDLLDQHGLFYCKAYRKRTIYLSPRAYSLLKQCRKQRPMTEHAQLLYGLLETNPPMETTLLKRFAALPDKAFKAAFDFLLENLYVTAYANGTVRNPTWSTFLYSTAAAWEKAVPTQDPCNGSAREALWAIVSSTLSEKEFAKLVG